ncbi:MAG: serine acetyltransferase, partial [bacterium]|nr:serine acetyltransferase [bacterium]
MTEPNPASHPRTLTEVVTRLSASYYEESVINHLGEGTLPSRAATLAILTDVKDVLFPDHRLERRVRSGQTGYIIGGILEKIHSDLRQQIFQARTYDYAGAPPSPFTLEQADNDALAFLARLPDLRSMLQLDVQAAMDGDPAAHSFEEIIFCYPGFEAVGTYRIAHELHRLGVPLLPRIMCEAAHSFTGCDIHPGAAIGKSFFIV